MAISSNGPGKKTKTTNKKATVKSTVSMIKNIFGTGGKNTGSGKGKNAAAGVVSKAGGVRTITDAKVTGSKKAGIESLKAKKKSGEMSRAEANAKIKNLRGISVTGKKQPEKKAYGESKMLPGGRGTASTYYASSKSIPSDSAKFMNQLKSTNPVAAKSFEKFMKEQQTKTPGARFQFGPGAVRGGVASARPGETPRKSTKKGYAEYYTPKVTTVLPKKKK